MSRGVLRSRNQEIRRAAGGGAGGAGTGRSAGSDDPSSRRTARSLLRIAGGPLQARMDWLEDVASLVPRNCSSGVNGEPGTGSLGRWWWRRQRLRGCRQRRFRDERSTGALNNGRRCQESRGRPAQPRPVQDMIFLAYRRHVVRYCFHASVFAHWRRWTFRSCVICACVVHAHRKAETKRVLFVQAGLCIGRSFAATGVIRGM